MAKNIKTSGRSQFAFLEVDIRVPDTLTDADLEELCDEFDERDVQAAIAEFLKTHLGVRPKWRDLILSDEAEFDVSH